MYKILLKEIDLKPQWQLSWHKSQPLLGHLFYGRHWYWAVGESHTIVLDLYAMLWHSLFSVSGWLLPTPTLWCGESFCPPTPQASFHPNDKLETSKRYPFPSPPPQRREKYSGSGFGFFHIDRYKIYCKRNLDAVLGWHFSVYCSTSFPLI